MQMPKLQQDPHKHIRDHILEPCKGWQNTFKEDYLIPMSSSLWNRVQKRPRPLVQTQHEIWTFLDLGISFSWKAESNSQIPKHLFLSLLSRGRDCQVKKLVKVLVVTVSSADIPSLNTYKLMHFLFVLDFWNLLFFENKKMSLPN